MANSRNDIYKKKGSLMITPQHCSTSMTKILTKKRTRYSEIKHEVKEGKMPN